MIICPNCNSETEARHGFCENCGEEIRKSHKTEEDVEVDIFDEEEDVEDYI